MGDLADAEVLVTKQIGGMLHAQKETNFIYDALSSTGMNMPGSAVAVLQGKRPNLSVMRLMKDPEPKGKTTQWGNWPQV